MREDFEIEIGTAFGPLAGKVWRIGAMGYNAMKHKVLITLGALEACLRQKASRCRRARRFRRRWRHGMREVIVRTSPHVSGARSADGGRSARCFAR